MSKETIFFTLCAAILTLILAPVARTESAQSLKASEQVIRDEMLKITQEIGTTCTECHKVTDFKDSAKPSFQTGLKHMKVVQAMKANGFDGKNGPEGNCYMCHRGELKPPAHAQEK